MNLVKKHSQDILLILMGNLILAFGVSVFILPYNILSGGVAGLAIALYPFFNIDHEIMINIIIVLSFILGYLFLGKDFALKTLASSILFPSFLHLFSFLELQQGVEPILASLYGGLLMGVGLGLTFRSGSSTGGMDIPPLILAKYTNIKVSIWIMVFDAFVVLLGLSAYGLNQVLIGFASIFSMSFAIDKVQMIGGNQAKQVLIISEKTEELLAVIHEDIDRGSTLFKGVGGFTESDRTLIMTVLFKRQYNELEKKVKEIDPKAFLIVSDVTEVHGEGFYKE